MRASVVVLALVACGHKAEDEASEGAPATVTCQPVQSRDVDETIDVSGVIAPQPKLDAVVSSPVAGRVALVAIEEGDHVAAGALLAVVEDPALPAGSIEAKAGVAAAMATKQAADQEVARQKRLVDSGIGARRDLDDAIARAGAAAAELDAANARAGLASQRLARRELRAPHAGVVLHVYRRAGESVDGTTSTPVAELADLTTLELRAQVPPAVLVKLKDGLTASVRVIGSDVAVPAAVERVAPAVDPTTLLGTVRVQLEPTKTTPPVGTAATASISIGRHPGLIVPATALRRSAVGTDEIVVCEGAASGGTASGGAASGGAASGGNVAKVRAVTIGHRDESGVEIVKGLAAGEQVVVDHVLGLDDGQQLIAGSGAAARGKP